MSVAQTAIASTRTRTSVGPGSGTGFSRTESSSGPPRTQAFIRSGIGYWLLRERASGCSLAMARASYVVACRLSGPLARASTRHVIMGRQGSRIAGHPNIGEVLADEVAGRDVPAL